MWVERRSPVIEDINLLRQIIDEAEADCFKAMTGNLKAGLRARRKMMELRDLAHRMAKQLWYASRPIRTVEQKEQANQKIARLVAGLKEKAAREQSSFALDSS